MHVSEFLQGLSLNTGLSGDRPVMWTNMYYINGGGGGVVCGTIPLLTVLFHRIIFQSKS
jgi:hypothetical protein